MRPLMALLVLAALVGSAGAVPCPVASTPAVGAALPLKPLASVVRRYRMAAKIRPLLLFWITRENVGGARITWHTGEDGTRGWELLIGSDPLRAPLKMNRWGYVREEVQPAGVSMLGVMTQSDEESIDQAKTRLASQGHDGYAFKMVRASVTDGVAISTTTGAVFARDYTYRDLDALLAALQGPTARRGAPRQVRLGPGMRGGLLVALTDLLRDSVEAFGRLGVAGLSPRTVKYVYTGTVYDLSAATPRIQKNARYAGRTYLLLLDGSFRIRNTTTGGREDFSVVYGVDGALAGIPVCITYQPRWWFKAELVLDDRETF